MTIDRAWATSAVVAGCALVLLGSAVRIADARSTAQTAAAIGARALGDEPVAEVAAPVGRDLIPLLAVSSAGHGSTADPSVSGAATSAPGEGASPGGAAAPEPPSAARAVEHRPAAPATRAAPPAPPPGEPSAVTFAREFPGHASARRDTRPESNSWAVIVGIDDYQGRTRDNIGSSGDAALLAGVLLANGWLPDHVLVLRDRAATHDRVVRALEWLIRSTDEHSTVVFSYSGHTRQNKGGSDPDRDGERTDEGLWAADNRTLWDADLARILGAIRSARMWITVQACEAAGFADPGLERPGRVITFSSREDQKSYEDPEVGLSVQGRYLFGEALRDGYGDVDGDGRVSVQEAFEWAHPRAEVRASGRQTPVGYDGLGGAPLHLRAGGW